MENLKAFSHVANFTDYMRVVVDYLAGLGPAGRILDLPAGNGLLSEALRGMGHEVISGDINGERPDYRYVDMSEPLPFADGEFDVVISLEGVEHLVNPVRFIAELARVTRGGGVIIITTPNVMNFYSRLQFLFTGVLYQFNPAAVPGIARGEVGDRGHVFPLSYFQLRYLFGQHGACVKAVLGDKWKRKTMLPVYLALLPFAWLWSRLLFFYQGDGSQAERNREMFDHAFS
ncbi:MAG: class I SAM-dependent methyltransferase, partial [bacterium]